MVSELTIEIPIVNTMITEWNGMNRSDAGYTFLFKEQDQLESQKHL